MRIDYWGATILGAILTALAWLAVPRGLRIRVLKMDPAGYLREGDLGSERGD